MRYCFNVILTKKKKKRLIEINIIIAEHTKVQKIKIKQQKH